MRCILRLFHALALGLLFFVTGAREAGAITYLVDRTLGSAFFATSTDLSFNFGSEFNDLVLFQTTPLGSGKEYYCLAANTTACITAATESLQIPDYTPASHQSEARSGVMSIGTVAAPPVINEVFKDSFENP